MGIFCTDFCESVSVAEASLLEAEDSASVFGTSVLVLDLSYLDAVRVTQTCDKAKVRPSSHFFSIFSVLVFAFPSGGFPQTLVCVFCGGKGLLAKF